MDGVLYVSDSGNTKLMGSKKVDATYVSIQASCPKDCPLMESGCYAQLSYVGITNSRLEKESAGASALSVAKAEVNAIDTSYGGKCVPIGRDLRLHVSGDSKTVGGTCLINKAVGRWKERGGGDCWSYTHAWKKVPRKEWSNVSILASVSNVEEVAKAREQGYAPTIVVGNFDGAKAFYLEGSETKWIPCPAQTREVGCSDCRLCMRSDYLFNANVGIAFEAHGIKKSSLKRKLSIIK